MRTYLRCNWPRLFGSSLVLGFIFFLLILTGAFSSLLLVYLFLLALFLEGLLFIAGFWREKRLYRFLSGETKELLKGDAALESRLLQQRFAAVLSQQEQIIQEKSKTLQQQIDFMNLWTHQMKTPLSVIELMAQENQLDHLAVLAETRRLQAGLNLALNEARLANGLGADFQLRQLSLEEIARTAVNQQRGYFIQRQVFPEVVGLAQLTVIADSKWLSFILEQLLVNAIKYSASGGKVVIDGGRYEDTTILQVRDTGIGIPAGDLPRIFQPFFTGENGRKFGEATGMGLYLVQEVAEAMGIQVTVVSEVGVGTTVTLHFQDDLTWGCDISP